MSVVTHQTVRLAAGKHDAPTEGVCVMELASMLAGEPFTDHPASVSPTIALLLRAYNDAVDDRRRQRLYPYAAGAVGSAGSAELERARVARLLTEIPRRENWLSRFLCGSLSPEASIDLVVAGLIRRVKGATSEEPHDRILGLIDELLEMRAEPTLGPAGHPNWPDREPASQVQTRAPA